MWLAHYSYHFLSSYDAVVPVTQRFLIDLGFTEIGQPAWVAACCRPVAAWLPHLAILFLDVGLLASLYAGYRIAQLQSPRPAQASQSVCSVGRLIGLPVYGGRVDRPPAHADAGCVLITASTMNKAFRFMGLLAPCLLIGADPPICMRTAGPSVYRSRRKATESQFSPTRRRSALALWTSACSCRTRRRGSQPPECESWYKRRPGRPNEAISHAATTELATNKLFQSAIFELPETGWWDIEVTVDGERGPLHLRFDAEAADRPPSWQAWRRRSAGRPWLSFSSRSTNGSCDGRRWAKSSSRALTTARIRPGSPNEDEPPCLRPVPAADASCKMFPPPTSQAAMNPLTSRRSFLKPLP